MYIYPLPVEPPSHSPPPSHSSRLTHAPGWAPVLHSNFPLAVYFTYVMYIFQCYSLNSSHSLFPLLCPQVCSLYLKAVIIKSLDFYHRRENESQFYFLNNSSADTFWPVCQIPDYEKKKRNSFKAVIGLLGSGKHRKVDFGNYFQELAQTGRTTELSQAATWLLR